MRDELILLSGRNEFTRPSYLKAVLLCINYVFTFDNSLSSRIT